MRHGTRFLWITSIALSCVLGSAASDTTNSGKTSETENGKIPITTTSEQARKEFLQGRDLFERLLAQDSVQHLDKAIALDPDFASAELARANSAATTKDFLDHLNKAVALSDKASEGERLMILANLAGTNGDVVKQKETLEKLVAAFPEDERAQFALGGYYFAQQDYAEAVEHNKKATELAPNYSPAYNILGYSYKQAGDYANAEQAFKKYIELIPNDPNPYDSYAELLLKMGKFEESVMQYRKALSIDPNFNASRFGMSAALTYLGKPGDAENELRDMAARARNDGELRTAYFGMAVLNSDGGHFDKALQAMAKEYAVAEKKNDIVSMAADLQAIGNINSEMQRWDVAKQKFDQSMQMMQDASVPQGVKDNAKLTHHLNMAAIAIGKKDYESAKGHAEEFRQSAEASGNALQVKQAHELAGRIALGQSDYDKAIAEMEQSNLQNPRNLFRLGQAYEGKGDQAKAQEFFNKAAQFDALPQLNYAFIRAKAQKMVLAKKA